MGISRMKKDRKGKRREKRGEKDARRDSGLGLRARSPSRQLVSDHLILWYRQVSDPQSTRSVCIPSIRLIDEVLAFEE
jgi:hypothetical protein